MKKCSFDGPGGETKVREPLAVRVVESPIVLTVLAVLFILWGGFYFYSENQKHFLGRRLSPAHQKLEKNCAACHVPFRGVTDQACMSADCHPNTMKDTIHNTQRQHCIECHPEHTDGLFMAEAVTSKGCADCHDKLKADPNSQFYPEKWEKRTVTNIPRTIFRHRLHQYPPHYKCWQCHCTGKDTLDLQMEDLFVMKSCMECHEQNNCKVCHPYHQKREPRPRHTSCIKQEFVDNLQFKTLECTPYKGREPGFSNLTVCETGESAVYKPPPADGSTAAPAAPAPAPGSTTSPSDKLP